MLRSRWFIQGSDPLLQHRPALPQSVWIPLLGSLPSYWQGQCCIIHQVLFGDRLHLAHEHRAAAHVVKLLLQTQQLTIAQRTSHHNQQTTRSSGINLWSTSNRHRADSLVGIIRRLRKRSSVCLKTSNGFIGSRPTPETVIEQHDGVTRATPLTNTYFFACIHIHNITRLVSRHLDFYLTSSKAWL